MNRSSIRLDNVVYNAATQRFEATVTVFGHGPVRKFACSIDAPITMTFEDAASGLAKQAMRRYEKRGGLHSTMNTPPPRQRAGRLGFDPMRWLEGILKHPGHKAA